MLKKSENEKKQKNKTKTKKNWFIRRFKNAVTVLCTFEFWVYHDLHNS